jgi:hypothetical protein
MYSHIKLHCNMPFCEVWLLGGSSGDGGGGGGSSNGSSSIECIKIQSP